MERALLFLSLKHTIMTSDLINIMIVDNEQSCIDVLQKDLQANPQFNILETFNSPVKAISKIIKAQPNVLFLDVEMPTLNGFELLSEIRSSMRPDLCVIFYSAFDKYMLEALRASSFDFLLKPYQEEELKVIIERIEENHKSKKPVFDSAMNSIENTDKRIAIQTIDGLRLQKSDDIVCFQFLSDLRCWQMMLSDRSLHKLRNTTVAKSLLGIGNNFMQTSQDCILNIDYLFSIENKTLNCKLYPPYQDVEIQLSRRYYSKIKAQLDII